MLVRDIRPQVEAKRARHSAGRCRLLSSARWTGYVSGYELGDISRQKMFRDAFMPLRIDTIALYDYHVTSWSVGAF